MCLPSRLPRVCVALLIAAQAPAALAQQNDIWVVNVGGDVDDEQGYRFDLGTTWVATDATSATLSLSRVDSSNDFNLLAATEVNLGFDHSFGPTGISLGARWWGDSDLMEQRTLAGSLYFKSELWRFSLNLEGGKKGLLVNSKDLCSSPGSANILFVAQSGRRFETSSPLKTSCSGKASRKRKGAGR